MLVTPAKDNFFKNVKILYRSIMEFTAAIDVLTSTNLKTVQLLYPIK